MLGKSKVIWEICRTDKKPVWDIIKSKMPTRILKGMIVYGKAKGHFVRIRVERVHPNGTYTGVVISEQSLSGLKRDTRVNISSEFIHSFSEK